MTDQHHRPNDFDAAAEAALEPGAPVTYVDRKAVRRYAIWLAIAAAAFTALFTAVPGTLLPNQIQAIEFSRWFTGTDVGINLQQLTDLKAAVAAGTVTPTTEQTRLLGILTQFDAARVSALAIVITIGTIATMLAQPLVGVFSDRTRTAFGRRAPWIFVGALTSVLALIGLRFSTQVALVAIFWMVALVANNIANTPLLTTVADRVPDARRGSVSSTTGLGNFIGGIVGALTAGGLYAFVGLNLYFLFGALALFGAVMFVIRNRDRSSRDLAVERFNWATFFRNFVIPLRAPDFRSVWIARVLLVFGFTVSGALGFFMLQSYIHPVLSTAEATRTAPLLGLVGLPLTLVAIVVAGRISDRIGRRKPFVLAASIIMAASMLVPIVSPTLPALFLQAALASLAFGIFLPVDQALFIDVLPDAHGIGRDLGIAAVATNLGQALGPVLASQVVLISGGYQLVWVAALVLIVFAGLAILPVKSAR